MGANFSPDGPAAGGAFLPTLTEEAPHAHLQSRGECIAIVDDEKSVLAVTQESLQVFGYETRTFDSTARFLKAFSPGAMTVDLLITDLTMPGVTGLELVRRLRQMGHQMPVLIMTGFSQHLRPTYIKGLGRVSLLRKPFTHAHLGQAVRRLLSGYAVS